MFFSFDHIIAWMLLYKYIILFPIAVIEGPIVTIIAAFLASSGKMDVRIVYLVVVMGDVVGDAIYYAVGRWGRRGLLDRYGQHIGVTPERLGIAQQHLNKHIVTTLLFGKWGQALGAPILLSSGALRINFLRFMTINTLGTLAKSLALVLIGYYFGSAYRSFNNYFTYFSIGATLLCIVVLAGHYARKQFYS